MISVEPTADTDYIKSVFLNPSIYDSMRDDSCPSTPSDTTLGLESAPPGVFLKVKMDGNPCGVFWLRWIDGAKIEVHTALLEPCRGRRAIDAAKALMSWVWSNTVAVAIRSYAWSDAPVVSWFCRAVGMREQETVAWPNTRNGKPVAITYFEIERGVA